MGSQTTLWRIVLLALMAYAMLSFASVRADVSRAVQLSAGMERELAQLREENSLLRAELESGYDDEEMSRLARERLGLVVPGEIIFYFEK